MKFIQIPDLGQSEYSLVVVVFDLNQFLHSYLQILFFRTSNSRLLSEGNFARIRLKNIHCIPHPLRLLLLLGINQLHSVVSFFSG